MSGDEQHGGVADRPPGEGMTTGGLEVTQPLVQQQPQPGAQPRPQLLAVPGPGQPADRRAEVARWVVTLSEPLLTTEDRTRTDAAMADFIIRNPEWACAYFAGLLTDLSATLPPDDPWRHLSAVIDLDQVGLGVITDDPDKRLVWTGSAPLPAGTGAVIKTPGLPARMFGTSADTLDLVPVDVPDLTTHLGVAALTTNLSPLGAAFVAIAASDPRTMQVVLSKSYHALFLAKHSNRTQDSAGASLLKTAGQAVQWLAHRRLQYMAGEDDGYAHTVGFEWISKADRVNTGKPISTEKSMVQVGKIDANAYKDLAGDDFV